MRALRSSVFLVPFSGPPLPRRQPSSTLWNRNFFCSSVALPDSELRMPKWFCGICPSAGSAAEMILNTDRKSTRLNSSHTVIYTLSLHDALPIFFLLLGGAAGQRIKNAEVVLWDLSKRRVGGGNDLEHRSEEHTSELQSHRDLHSFPTRRSSDLFSAPRWRCRTAN